MRDYKELKETGKRLGFELAEGDDRAKANVGRMAQIAISLVVALAVGGMVAAFLLPVGINEIVGVNGSGNWSQWSSGAQSIWLILDIVIVLAVMLFFFAVALSATELI